MKAILNKLALIIFDLLAAGKGYRFERATTPGQKKDVAHVYGEDGFSFPDELKPMVASYAAGTASFIAYYNEAPVGSVRLADPSVVNRPWELYGIDIAGDHSEIQSLVVKKAHRDRSQFVMLGLFRQMYTYSRSRGVHSWSSCGSRSVYLTMRRFCRGIQTGDIDFAAINHPLTQYLYHNNIIDTYFTMEVSAFEPWTILRWCLKQLAKKWSGAHLINFKRSCYEGLGYRCK